MSKERTPVNLRKGIKIDAETRKLYEQRDRRPRSGLDTRAT